MKAFLKSIGWVVFANEFAFGSSFAMIVGGIIGIVASIIIMFPKCHISVFSVIAGMIVFLLEYPRCYIGEKFEARRHQRYIEPYIAAMGFFGRNYYIRSAFYVLISIPCVTSLLSLLGGVCIFTASIAYLCAAIGGFEWKQKPTEKPSDIKCDTSCDNFPAVENTYVFKETVT